MHFCITKALGELHVKCITKTLTNLLRKQIISNSRIYYEKCTINTNQNE